MKSKSLEQAAQNQPIVAETSATPATPNVPCNTRTVGRNFVFMGLEVAISLVVMLTTTIYIARVIGPTRLGYFNLVLWLVNIACSVGSLGIPLTTLKYLGEFLGAGKKDYARAVFFYSLRAQTLISCALTGISLVVVLTLVDPQYRVCSVLLVLSMLPYMMTFIPSQANTAAENSKLNTRGALAGAIVYVITVTVSLLVGWNLVGIAAGLLLSRTVELVVKIIPVLKSVEGVPRVPLPIDIQKRMFTFSSLSSGLMLVQIIVWDRSDIIFLKLLQPDIRQLAFFSVCFSLADRLVLPVQAFANALSATQMAEYGRNKIRLFNITSLGFVYMLMGILPIMIGIACISGPFIRVVYGPQYLPAIPVFAVIALMSIPKAVLTPAQTLLYSTEEVGFVLKVGLVASVLNIALDVALIPKFGAMGAAFANGITQTLAVTAIWLRVLVRYPVRPDKSVLLRLVAATAAMAIVVLGIVAAPLTPVIKLALAVPAGAIIFLLTGRAFMMWRHDDRRRLLMVSNLVPTPARQGYERLVNFIVSAAAVAEVSR
jgi:O-antigen/teichoic acid export membrane protein